MGIKWNMQIMAEGGPSLVIPPQKIDVDAYDVINIKITQGTTLAFGVVPDDASNVQFLAITSDSYDKTITYQTCNGADPTAGGFKKGSAKMVLDYPHVFFDNSMLQIFKDVSPSYIVVTNGFNADINISILVGRSV